MDAAQTAKGPPALFLTLEEAAEIARAPLSTVRHWVAVGKLAGRRPGRRVLIRRSDLAAFLGVTPGELG